MAQLPHPAAPPLAPHGAPHDSRSGPGSAFVYDPAPHLVSPPHGQRYGGHYGPAPSGHLSQTQAPPPPPPGPSLGYHHYDHPRPPQPTYSYGYGPHQAPTEPRPGPQAQMSFPPSVPFGLAPGTIHAPAPPPALPAPAPAPSAPSVFGPGLSPDPGAGMDMGMNTGLGFGGAAAAPAATAKSNLLGILNKKPSQPAQQPVLLSGVATYAPSPQSSMHATVAPAPSAVPAPPVPATSAAPHSQPQGQSRSGPTPVTYNVFDALEPELEPNEYPEGEGEGEGEDAEESIFRDMTFDEVLEELNARFLVNLPREEMGLVRVYWQAEQAHWFYEDYLRPLNPNLPSLSQRQFSQMIIASSPIYPILASSSSTYSENDPFSNSVDPAIVAVAAPPAPGKGGKGRGKKKQQAGPAVPLVPTIDYDRVWAEYVAYKSMVPCCGGIILNETGDKALVVRGWKSSAGWCFPRGKININEPELECAIREVYEETGFDLTGYIKDGERDRIQTQINAQTVTMFIAMGVKEGTRFEARTKKEIGAIEWVSLTDLPTWSGRKPKRGNGGDDKAKRYYNVTPFVGPLKKWLVEHGVPLKPAQQTKGRRNAPPQGASYGQYQIQQAGGGAYGASDDGVIPGSRDLQPFFGTGAPLPVGQVGAGGGMIIPTQAGGRGKGKKGNGGVHSGTSASIAAVGATAAGTSTATTTTTTTTALDALFGQFASAASAPAPTQSTQVAAVQTQTVVQASDLVSGSGAGAVRQTPAAGLDQLFGKLAFNDTTEPPRKHQQQQEQAESMPTDEDILAKLLGSPSSSTPRPPHAHASTQGQVQGLGTDKQKKLLALLGGNSNGQRAPASSVPHPSTGPDTGVRADGNGDQAGDDSTSSMPMTRRQSDLLSMLSPQKQALALSAPLSLSSSDPSRRDEYGARNDPDYGNASYHQEQVDAEAESRKRRQADLLQSLMGLGGAGPGADTAPLPSHLHALAPEGVPRVQPIQPVQQGSPLQTQTQSPYSPQQHAQTVVSSQQAQVHPPTNQRSAYGHALQTQPLRLLANGGSNGSTSHHAAQQSSQPDHSHVHNHNHNHTHPVPPVHPLPAKPAKSLGSPPRRAAQPPTARQSNLLAALAGPKSAPAPAPAPLHATAAAAAPGPPGHYHANTGAVTNGHGVAPLSPPRQTSYASQAVPPPPVAPGVYGLPAPGTASFDSYSSNSQHAVPQQPSQQYGQYGHHQHQQPQLYQVASHPPAQTSRDHSGVLHPVPKAGATLGLLAMLNGK